MGSALDLGPGKQVRQLDERGPVSGFAWLRHDAGLDPWTKTYEILNIPSTSSQSWFCYILQASAVRERVVLDLSPILNTMATRSDVQVAALAAGFTLGFGFLTVWEAIKQTRVNRNPLRSAYIYMIWGEIVANIVIGILGWVFLAGMIGPTYVYTTYMSIEEMNLTNSVFPFCSLFYYAGSSRSSC